MAKERNFTIGLTESDLTLLGALVGAVEDKSLGEQAVLDKIQKQVEGN